MLKKKRKEENEESNFSNEIDVNNTISSTPKNSHIYLEPINTNCFAMYQTVKSSNAVDNTVDLMKVQVSVASLFDLVYLLLSEIVHTDVSFCVTFKFR